MPPIKRGSGTVKRNKVAARVDKEAERKVYRNGWDGFKKWCEDKVCIPIYPEGSDVAMWCAMRNLPSEPNPKTGRSYQVIWREQLKIAKEALRMENGRFVYRLIVLCWMRGEGKSLLACLIQLWKFFNWDRQQIMLGANSKDQIKFVHYDIMRDIVLNSPELLNDIGGKRNIKEKEMRIRDSSGRIVNLLRAISSFSGIVSNITGYTFSEIFDMKNPKFFVQLDGSIRNIPNALGVIDSTVSAKTHVLYQLFENARKKKTKGVFFSYRFSPGPDGNPDDYWNPMMDKDQLVDYKAKFPFGEYERYFLNLWSAGTEQVFTDEMIEEIGILSVDGEALNHFKIVELLEEKAKYLQIIDKVKNKGSKIFEENILEYDEKIDHLNSRFSFVDDMYSLKSNYGVLDVCGLEELLEMGDIFDTDWAVLGGMDFGDPYAIRGLANTICTVVAKGLPGSRLNPALYTGQDVAAPKYLYFLLQIKKVDSHSLDVVKDILEEAMSEYDGIDSICSERYGAWDMEKWCEERYIKFEPIFPNYDRQKAAFKEILLAVREGRFKSPVVPISGSKQDDILREEMSVFMHSSEERWFGSPEKMEKYGIQDDCMFSIGWTIYGGREIGVDDFKPRKAFHSFGEMYQNKSLLGLY